MLIIDAIQPVLTEASGAVVALGNFDGVHLGHQKVLARAREIAKLAGRPFGVMTFEPHPRAVFFPEQPPSRITPVKTKRRVLQQLGVEILFEIPFTIPFSELSADAFIEDILLHHFNISHAVAGHDFVFGHKRGGTMKLLRAHLPKYGVQVSEVAPQLDNTQAQWSSTRIREQLAEGEIKAVTKALGRFWEMEGEVLHGDERGAALGFPTANLAFGHSPDDLIRPKFGVYAVRVAVDGHVLHGVANFGTRPTVDGKRELLEVHAFNFSGNLYGKQLRVAFVDFIRPEKAFASLEALKAQITEDCVAARRLLEQIAIR